MNAIPLSFKDTGAVLIPPGSCAENTPTARKKTAILLFPGGAYQTHTQWECERMANFFADHEFAAFVVKYSVGVQASFPELLRQASCAVWYVRSHCDEFGVAPERVVACGFSAGAHLVTMLATHWSEDAYQIPDMPFGGNKVDATITGYTPTTFEDFNDKIGISARKKNDPRHLLSGEEGFDSMSSLTTHTRVTASTPPAFLWKTTADLPTGTFEYAMALERNHVPYELHVFNDTHRCASAAAWNTEEYSMNTHTWPTLAIHWLSHIFATTASDEQHLTTTTTEQH